MTQKLNDNQLNTIDGGGRIENLFAKLNRKLQSRQQGGTVTPTPGGPGPELEAEDTAGGTQNLMK